MNLLKDEKIIDFEFNILRTQYIECASIISAIFEKTGKKIAVVPILFNTSGEERVYCRIFEGDMKQEL